MCEYCIFFFFNDTATTEIYTLSLHDALPISAGLQREVEKHYSRQELRRVPFGEVGSITYPARARESYAESLLGRSEEHTSELQSQSNLVCRLLLEKKKKTHSLSFPYTCHYLS